MPPFGGLAQRTLALLSLRSQLQLAIQAKCPLSTAIHPLYAPPISARPAYHSVSVSTHYPCDLKLRRSLVSSAALFRPASSSESGSTPGSTKHLFAKTHEWLAFDVPNKPRVCTVGISDYAQEKLGELVFVALPAVGKRVGRGEEAGTVESVKAASEIYSPISGTVVEVNAAVKKEPTLINKHPLSKGWLFRLEVSAEDAAGKSEDVRGLLNSSAYKSHCESSADAH